MSYRTFVVLQAFSWKFVPYSIVDYYFQQQFKWSDWQDYLFWVSLCTNPCDAHQGHIIVWQKSVLLGFLLPDWRCVFSTFISFHWLNDHWSDRQDCLFWAFLCTILFPFPPSPTYQHLKQFSATIRFKNLSGQIWPQYSWINCYFTFSFTYVILTYLTIVTDSI